MPNVSRVRRRFTIQMRKYSPPVPVNWNGSTRVEAAALGAASRVCSEIVCEVALIPVSC
jgi:hypothetical protein